MLQDELDFSFFITKMAENQEVDLVRDFVM